jgi:positive regulator of sigma E activity
LDGLSKIRLKEKPLILGAFIVYLVSILVLPSLYTVITVTIFFLSRLYFS